MPALRARQPVQPPPGFEDYLSRREAARQLGLASEFKIRQLERQGRLHAVRGRMGTAFYPKTEVLSLRVELDSQIAMRANPGRWSDADLVILLSQARPDGRQRTALDLVQEARISISRAERVFAFYQSSASPQGGRTEPEPSDPADSQVLLAGNDAAAALPCVARRDDRERRGQARLDRDSLIKAMRHPDPQIRADAFARLKHATT